MRLPLRQAEALNTIIGAGTSAGGSRAKAVIAWNSVMHEVRSGQVAPPPGFEPWILKLDGVNDAALGDPQGFRRVEYAYHQMAVAAGVDLRPPARRGRLPRYNPAGFVTRTP